MVATTYSERVPILNLPPQIPMPLLIQYCVSPFLYEPQAHSYILPTIQDMGHTCPLWVWPQAQKFAVHLLIYKGADASVYNVSGNQDQIGLLGIDHIHPSTKFLASVDIHIIPDYLLFSLFLNGSSQQRRQMVAMTREDAMVMKAATHGWSYV